MTQYVTIKYYVKRNTYRHTYILEEKKDIEHNSLLFIR